jgi:hypothetical protein
LTLFSDHEAALRVAAACAEPEQALAMAIEVEREVELPRFG